MSVNPLKKYFRQPKIFINLASKGVYNEPGTLQGDPQDLPVFGMTGMDEILMKTPDALLNGESTAKVIESCCPSVKDAWRMSILDLDLLLVAIRIATYGNTMTVTHTCPSCSSINDYDIDLGTVVHHYSNLNYENKIALKDLSIKIKPLTYKEWTTQQLKTFALQRQVNQALGIEDTDEQEKVVQKLFLDLAEIQRETLLMQIDQVDIPEGAVNQREFITEWMANSEQNIFEELKAQIEKNRLAWEIPKMGVTCPECNAENKVAIVMDQAGFFGRA